MLAYGRIGLCPRDLFQGVEAEHLGVDALGPGQVGGVGYHVHVALKKAGHGGVDHAGIEKRRVAANLDDDLSAHHAVGLDHAVKHVVLGPAVTGQLPRFRPVGQGIVGGVGGRRQDDGVDAFRPGQASHQAFQRGGPGQIHQHLAR